MKPHRLVLLGPPASGKGTQGRLMSEHWGVAVVSAGDVLRGEIARRTPLGQEAARYMDHGGLVPDRVAVAAVAGWLEAHGDAFVFDGFPRTVGQAEMLDALLARHLSASPEAAAGLTAVIWLDLATARIEERVSRRVVCAECGRSFQVGTHVTDRRAICPVCGGTLSTRNDDDPAKLATRMVAYQESTAPLMDYYDRRGLLRRIDADLPPDAVFLRIEAAVNAGAEAGAAVVP